MSKTKYLVINNLKGKIKKNFYVNALTSYWRRLSTPSRCQYPAVPICFQLFYLKVTLHGNHSNEVAEQYFTVVLFITLYNVDLVFASVDKNLKRTLLAEFFFILPLLFRGPFTAVFTVVVFFHTVKTAETRLRKRSGKIIKKSLC